MTYKQFSELAFGGYLPFWELMTYVALAAIMSYSVRRSLKKKAAGGSLKPDEILRLTIEEVFGNLEQRRYIFAYFLFSIVPLFSFVTGIVGYMPLNWNHLIVIVVLSLILGVLCTFILGGHLLAKSFSRRDRIVMQILRGLLLAILFLGIFLMINGIADSSPFRIIQGTITEKLTDGTRYVLRLDYGLNSQIQSEKLTVSSEVFQAEQQGNTINLRVKSGLFGIPWIYDHNSNSWSDRDRSMKEWGI